MDVIKDREGNVDPANNEEVSISLVKSESEVSIKIGDKLIRTKYRVYDDDKVEFDIPEGMEQEDFEKYTPSVQALINKANFEKNDKIRNLEEENRRLKSDVKDTQEPIDKATGNEIEYKLTPQDYGFKTEEEEIIYAEDYPVEYARKTRELHNKLLNKLANNLTNKLTVTQTENILRNQANADKLKYEDYVKFTKENELSLNTKSYGLYKKIVIADRERDVSLKNKQDSSITFRKTGVDPSAKSNSGKSKIDWRNPLG